MLLSPDAFTIARMNVAPHILETPTILHTSTNLVIKLENQQLTHSFKLRGALNKVLKLSPDQLRKGLVTGSAGNHGQGVALAAQRLDHGNTPLEW